MVFFFFLFFFFLFFFFFFQAEDGIRDAQESRGLGDVYKRQVFSRTLGFLLNAGIPLIRSLRISREVVENSFLRELLVNVEEDVRGGISLGVALDKVKYFPVLLHQLVTVGEESGQTANILIKSALTFETIVSNQLSRLVAALQPALILILAVAVGGITITMLSAVFSMNAVEF